MSNTSAQTTKPLTYTIRVAAKLTGVNAHLIRIWERRYKAVKPVRTMTNRRLYSDKELERLSLFRQLTEAGHSIGSIATLETEQLRSLLPSAANHPSRFTPVIVEPHGAESLRNGLDESAPHAAHRALDLGMDAIGRMDAAGLEAALNESVLRLGHQGFLIKVAAPLVQRVGDAWHTGELTAGHEHFASSLLKTFLANLARTNITHPGAPHIVIATPRAQHHEIGAYLANAAAANCGWRVTFLGPDLPAAEIAIAARQCGARAVALSLVYPITDASLTGELTQLKNALPPECALVIGGRAAGAHATLINQIGATLIEDLTVFCTWLSR